MAIVDLDDWVKKLNGGNNGSPERIPFRRDKRVAGAAVGTVRTTRWTSAFLTGGQPGPGSAPGTTARIPDNTTPGGLLQTDALNSLKKYLTGWSIIGSTATAAASANTGAVFMLYDRLLDNSGRFGNVTTAQNVGGSLTRHTDGVGVQAAFEIYSAIGGTGTTGTISYTDTDANTQNSVAMVLGGAGFQEQYAFIPIAVAQGDIGVAACASFTLAATTGTAGDMGVTLYYPIDYLCTTNVGAVTLGALRDYVMSIPPNILDDACLCLAYAPVSTVSHDIYGMAHFIDA